MNKSKIAAGLLQLLLPCGVGRFYLGYTGIGLAQLILALLCGVGVIWCWVDGILILCGTPHKDAYGNAIR